MDRRDALCLLGLGAIGCARGTTRAITPAPRRYAEPPRSPDAAKPRDRWRRRLVEARERNLTNLSLYAQAGMFPIYLANRSNPKVAHRALGDREPVFVDHRGVPCAVGFLMQQSGAGTAVVEIAEADNHVRVEEVSDGPLIDWLLTSGLTQTEAAQIQPSYGGIDPEPSRVYDLEVTELRRHFKELDVELRRETPQSIENALDRLLAIRDVRSPTR